MDRHYWIRAPRRRDRERARDALDLPPVLAVVDAHRRLRGPYTAAGTLVRHIGDDALRRRPDLGVRDHIAILTSAPEFAGRVPAIETPLEMATAPGERSRFQARLHTLRVAHGLVEFLRDYLVALGGGPRTLVVENVHEADPTDHEFLAVLVRRIPPSLLTVVVGSQRPTLADPPGPVAVSLPQALAAHTEPLDAAPAAEPAEPVATEADPDESDPDESDVDELARAYVDGDGTSDDPAQLAAYQALPADRRAALHDERAEQLLALGEFSLRLGAVAYHREHGSDPAGAGVESLHAAQLHCRNLGIYHAAADLGERGRRLVDPVAHRELWWSLTGLMTTSLSSAGRAEEAEAVYEEARGLTQDPVDHMNLAYATAMLYTRHYDEPNRDHQRARCWLNLAIAIASVLEDPKERAYHSVFNRNGLALVEVRQGRPDEALRLLTEGMERLDRELAPGERLMHRTGLRYNRAQVHIMTGRLTEALTELTAVMEVDRGFADHHFNRGNVLRRLGRFEEAIADYEAAIALSPPFPEVHYNRGDARLELGDVDGALADFDRVLELDPDNVDARLNRAGIHCDLGAAELAWQDVTAGLALAPDNAHLLCLRGRLLAERGERDAAREALSEALGVNERLAEAWALRGAVNYEDADLVAAARDLDRAVELSDAAQFRFNRGMVHEAAGRLAEAAADYEAVLAATGDPEARTRRDACRGTGAQRVMV